MQTGLIRFGAVAWALSFVTTLAAQVPLDSVEPETPAPIVPADAAAIARAAAARGDQAEALSQYLRVLSTHPNDVEALAGAGRAALSVGDINAATGFFARAEELAPTNGMVKAGLGSASVQGGNARAALRYFRQALALGIVESVVAEDRGLAYDLNGDNRRAQAQYQLALRTNPADTTAARRLALSQAIAGDLPGALITLDPLLRKQDIPAWRTRAFAKALSGDVPGAEQDAALVLPPNQVATLRPYLVRLAALKPADKAAAVFLGRFPPAIEARTTVARASTPTPAKTGALSSVFSLKPRTPKLVADQSVSAEPAPIAQPEPIAAPPPAAEPVVEDSPALRAKRRAVAAAEAKQAQAAQKKKADAAKATEAAKLAKANPARHWVQVAGGANKADLPRAWSQLKAKYPGQLSGRSPWTMHYRFTNRLMIGPFPTAGAAQDWVTARKSEGMATFRVSTRSGEAVERM